MAPRTEKAKQKWLMAYASEINRQLASCKKAPTWQQYPAGHMRMAQGISPKKAATMYLDETVYGRQACRRSR